MISLNRRWLGCFALLLMLGGGAACAFSQKLTVAERYLFEAANQERRAAGLSPLRWNPQLAQAARLHAQQMAQRNTISHQFAGESGLMVRAASAEAHFSKVAENVGMSPSPISMHDAWMHSPGHRANILDPKLTSLGVSVVYRNGYLWAVQDFARDVEDLSIEEQEQHVNALLYGAGNLNSVQVSDAARQSCLKDSGYAGARKPWFIMRYSSSDLSHLPAQLITQLRTGKYAEAEVGACVRGKSNFSGYSIAVLLYP